MYTRQKKPIRKLERRNAFKNSDYEPPSTTSPSSSFSSSSSSFLDLQNRTCSSLDSYRIEGSVDGEVDFICRSLGFNGPDDFAISADDWAAHKPCSPVVSRGVRNPPIIAHADVMVTGIGGCCADVSSAVAKSSDDVSKARIGAGRDVSMSMGFGNDDVIRTGIRDNADRVKGDGDVEGKSGIKGVRPPLLARPPVMSPRVVLDDPGSTWDLVRSFGPEISKPPVVKEEELDGIMALTNVVGESSFDVSDEDEEDKPCSTGAIELEY
nr:hypothetical protein [Tanacetum cinerariifolium]